MFDDMLTFKEAQRLGMLLYGSVEHKDAESRMDECLTRAADQQHPGVQFSIKSVEHWDFALRNVDYLRGVIPIS